MEGGGLRYDGVEDGGLRCECSGRWWIEIR